jgi:outer membrane protein OmpA-like peptidoglycan-associated protein
MIERDRAAEARRVEEEQRAAEKERMTEQQRFAEEERLAREVAERVEAEKRGRIETAANRVLIDENERLQQLDGMLPMSLSLDERGMFDFDRYELRPEVKAILDVLASKLNESAYDRLHVMGFADRLGEEDYNQRLSEKRAWAVAGYLMNKGVPPYKLRVQGRGERDSQPTNDQCEGLDRPAMIECLQKDRRVEIAATVKDYQLKVQ